MGDTNTFIPEGIYALANPSSGITALNMNCECNLFGRKTYFNMTSFETFDIIDDAPVEKEVEKEEGSWWGNLITGIIATAALAACAIAVVATGGAALGAIMLAGAAIGTGIVTVSAAITDAKSGQARSWTQFLGDLVTGGITGAVAGATIYGLWTAAPIVGQAFGIQASMLLGGVTKFTAITIPKIFAGFGKFLIGTQGVRYLNEITSIGSGQNWLLDHIFGGNQENYTTAGMCLDLFSMGYVQIASDNAGLAEYKDNKTDKDNFETVIKEKESLVDTEADSKGLESKTTYKKFENVIEADKELSEQYSDWEKSLTKEEREALQAYTGDNYKNINQVLRGKESDYIGNNEQYAKNIESALNKAEVPEDIITYRGTTPSVLGEIIDLSPEDMVGKILHDDAFVSTSVNPLIVEYGYSEKGVTFIIEIPKGTSGAYIAPVSNVGLGEAELLLNKGQDMIILEVVNPNKNNLVLRVQIVP